MSSIQSNSIDTQRPPHRVLCVNPHLKFPLKTPEGWLRPLQRNTRWTPGTTQESLQQNSMSITGIKPALTLVKEISCKQHEKIVVLTNILEDSRNQLHGELDVLSELMKRREEKKKNLDLSGILNEESFFNNVPPVESLGKQVSRIVKPRRKFKSLFDAVSTGIYSLAIKL